MLFNTQAFLIFYLLVFAAYWLLKKHYKAQNILLLVVSYYFYSQWNWHFSFLLLFSTLLDYFSGIFMAQAKNQSLKKFWFWTSIIVNLGFLAVFKYYNFFIDSVSASLKQIGLETSMSSLEIILPVGISFYTFHGLSYVIDIYKDRIKPERNFVDYAVFVAYFPLLVAGPIERATHLLPQIQKKREFNYANAVDGLRQVLWGLFKKVVIADNCAEFANQIFNNPTDQSGMMLILGAVFFSFQIYGDFSGYSDIALGCSRMLGIELLKNFNYPYFSRNIAEFWRRWHISLSTWFKDYLYIPLGGSQGGNWQRVKNTFIIFLVSGFWHGANWTFVAWGFLNALFIMPSILQKSNRNFLDVVAKGRILPNLKEISQLILTFALSTFAWVFFRAESLSKAFDYIGGIFSHEFGGLQLNIHQKSILGLSLFLFMVEWLGREQDFALRQIKLPLLLRWLFYMILIVLILALKGNDQQFIYFQF